MNIRLMTVFTLLASAVGCGPAVSPTSTPAVQSTPSTRPADKPGDDGKTNRQYTAWAKYKPGTTVTLTGSGMTGDSPTPQTVVGKLLEVTDAKCVVEMETTFMVNGEKDKAPPSKMDVPRDKPEFLPVHLDHTTGKPVGVTEEGTQTKTISGTEFVCKWYKYKQSQPDEEGELWVCDDFPGRVVKLIQKTKQGEAMLEATAVTLKK